MTTEIDHSLNTYPHNYMTTSYETARKDRLTDIVGDYITDEDTSAEQFFNDLVHEIDTWSDYHQKYLEKCKLLKKMVNGHRPIDPLDSILHPDAGDYIPEYLAEDVLAL
jgi:hypothetical protein